MRLTLGTRAVYGKGMVGGEENVVQLPIWENVLANNYDGRERPEEKKMYSGWSSGAASVCPPTAGLVTNSR